MRKIYCIEIRIDGHKPRVFHLNIDEKTILIHVRIALIAVSTTPRDLAFQFHNLVNLALTSTKVDDWLAFTFTYVALSDTFEYLITQKHCIGVQFNIDWLNAFQTISWLSIVFLLHVYNETRLNWTNCLSFHAELCYLVLYYLGKFAVKQLGIL